jgi:hypothetical protein
VLAKGIAEQQNALVRIATNSLQCEWATDAATSMQRVKPLACSSCVDTSCSLGHLVQCAGPQATPFRADLRRDILAVIYFAPQTDSCCHQFGMLDSRAMLLRLFSIADLHPNSDEQAAGPHPPSWLAR